MTLREFLDTTHEEIPDFARRIGVTKEAVRLWITGGRTPRAAQMRAISDATGGEVRPNDFLPIIEPAANADHAA